MKERLQPITLDHVPCQQVCVLSGEPQFAPKADAELESLFKALQPETKAALPP